MAVVASFRPPTNSPPSANTPPKSSPSRLALRDILNALQVIALNHPEDLIAVATLLAKLAED